MSPTGQTPPAGPNPCTARPRASRADAILDRLRGPLAVMSLATASAVLCGLFLHPRAFVLAAGTMAALLVGLAWPWAAMRGLSGSISFDRDRAREGDEVVARLAVRNRLPFAAWGLSVRDPGRGPGGGLARAKGWASTEAAWRVALPCRGEYPGPACRIATAFPFGLREAGRPLAVPRRLLAWPATFPVGPIPEEAAGRDGCGHSPRNRAGTEGDLMGVRPYRRGDSLRRVHWPQTARHGELIVCELHDMATPRVQILLDVHPGSHAGEAPGGTLEWAVRVAASFAEGWSLQGAEVELAFGRERTRSGAGTPAVRRARLLDALARLRPDDGVDLAGLLDLADRGGRRDGLRIVIATDLAARGLPPRPPRARSERFVLLRAAAFSADLAGDGAGPPPMAPWLWLDDPGRVPGMVRRGWKEMSHG